MAEWEFLQDARRSWYWRRTDERGSHSVSPRTFETKAECMRHAASHGYVPDAPEEPGAAES